MRNQKHTRTLGRRLFLQGATLAAPLASQVVDRPVEIARPGEKAESPGSPVKPKLWLQNAINFGDLFVSWQNGYGAPDPVRCPYRTRGRFGPTQLHTTGPVTRALYRLYDETKINKYKDAADGYAAFHLNTLRDPNGPHDDEVALYGAWYNRLSRSWVYGKGLSPCFDEFRRHNPGEDAFDVKAFACYRWLQKYRREDSYFGIGYASGKYPDGQFSCDLGEVGNGLVGFYSVFRYKPALEDAIGLAGYFLSDWEPNSGRGVWSPSIGMWLLGPWPNRSGEHVTSQVQSDAAWGWSAYVAGNYLLRLRGLVSDEKLRASIGEKCVAAFRWCYDACQYPDGSHGMFGRDDKWVGMGAAALLLYLELKAAGALADAVDAEYRPKVESTWRWLAANTAHDTYPNDGYIKVTGGSTKKPLENLVWLMSWTLEALLAGGRHFDSA